MPTCFVIQPFNEKFNSRFHDTFKKAIEAADLRAYRVDEDPKSIAPIDSIESGIKKSAICFADITEDNPNVWYELGFAFAAGKKVVMACEKNRDNLPFDIRHRSVIFYKTDSLSDYEKLKNDITSKIKAVLEQPKSIDSIPADKNVESTNDLSQTEKSVLLIVAERGYLGSTYSVYLAQQDAEKAGWSSFDFNLAIKRLTSKKLITLEPSYDEHSNFDFDVIQLSESAWAWIEFNEQVIPF